MEKKKTKLTLQDIRESEKEMLTPADVSHVLRCDSYTITLQAKADPKKLGFPVIVMGSRVRIPKAGFLRFCELAGLHR